MRHSVRRRGGGRRNRDRPTRKLEMRLISDASGIRLGAFQRRKPVCDRRNEIGRPRPGPEKEEALVKRPSLAIAVAASALVLAMGLVACGDDDDSTDTGGGGGGGVGEVVIGASLPLTGDLTDYGPPGEKAANLAISEIKKAGGQVTLETADNETTPQGAVQAARELLAKDASCISGAWASTDTIPTARSVTIPEEVPLISPASTAYDITELDDDGTVFRTSPTDNLQGPALANLIEESIGDANGKTVNVGARDDAYGTGFVEFFTKAWEDKGGTIGESVLYDPTQPSYNSEAQQIVSGNPDAFAIIDFPETFVKVGPALQRTGKWDSTKTFITDGLADDTLVAENAELMKGVRGTAPGTPAEGASSKAFDKAYTAAAPTDVKRQTFDAQTFDSVMLCYLGAVAAGSTNGPDIAAQLQDVSGPGGTKYSWTQLPEAIKALENGEDIDYVGASGELDLDDNGDPSVGTYDELIVKNGAFESTGQIQAEGLGG
jgi:branched-chain amino acid transport system substrate-binding protein